MVNKGGDKDEDDGEEAGRERLESDIENYQVAQQQLQLVVLQKQQMKLETEELDHALSEMKKASGAVYKIVGPILIQSKKEDVEKDLIERKEFLSSRIEILDKQEERLKKNLAELRKSIESKRQQG